MNSDAPSPEKPPQPEDPHTGPAEEEAAVDDEVLARALDVIDPATVRRAPKFAAFGVSGAVGGLIVGLIIGLIAFWSAPNRGWMVATLMLELAIFTTILALIWALLADRRSRKPRVRAQQTVRD